MVVTFRVYNCTALIINFFISKIFMKWYFFGWIQFLTFLFYRIYAENPDDAAKQCLSLLEEPDLDSSVRVGDVYAFLIEHYACQEKWNAVSIEVIF